jgi:hypothetical protein
MRLKFARHRAGALILSSLIGTTMIVGALTAPAGASTPVAPGDTVLAGGGSQTTYTMMQQLSDLYNSAPGCQLLTSSSSAQQADYDCAASYSTASGGEEEGYNLSYPPANPFNDVFYQMPPLGSSVGIAELENQDDAPSSPPYSEDSALGFARSSRSAKSTDDPGLNFVAYAADAVPWTAVQTPEGFTCDNAKGKELKSTKGDPITAADTDAGKLITGMTEDELESIYTGGTTNWSAVGGQNAPIDVFIAQSGSGTESTFTGDIGIPSTDTYPYAGVTETSTRTGAPATLGAGGLEVFENEVSDIYQTNSDYPQTKDNGGTDGILCNAIFFFSYGKFSQVCPKGVCAGTPKALKGTTWVVGLMNGIPTKPETWQEAIECQFGPDFCAEGYSPYPTDRQLYNVYSDGSNPDLPYPTPTGGSPTTQNQAIMNFVSTYGFLCNPNIDSEIDPITGDTYLSEIDSIITNAGFYTIPEDTMGDSSIETPPVFTTQTTINGNPYGYANDATTPPTITVDGHSAPDAGYCRVSTTDENSS